MENIDETEGGLPMRDRYIEQYRLQPRQYTTGCPVVLTAGVLLEDTLLSRQIAQLKFKSIVSSPIVSLSVEIKCFDASGAKVGTVASQYSGLNVTRSQSFGQRTAVPLPAADIRRLRVIISSVTFADGSVWAASEDTLWGVLPAFRRLEGAEADAAQATGNGPYAYAAPADLWYCTCGSVNHQVETACHRCRRDRTMAAAPAPTAPEEQAKAQEAPPSESVSVPEPPKAPFPETVPFPAAEHSEAAPKKESHKRRIMFAAAAAAAVLLLLVLILPKGSKDSSHESLLENLSSIAAPKEELVPPNVTTSSDNGTVSLVLTQTEGEEYCKLTFDMLQEVVPTAQSFSSFDSPPMGDDIDTYLSFSHHMMTMVYRRMDTLYSDGGYNNIFPQIDRIYTVLLFSDPTTLCGYFVGSPEDLGDGKWQITITLCDYNFSALYKQRAAAFAAADTDAYPYIRPEDAASCGAKYFYFGYGSNGYWEGTQTEQMYYLWTQMTSPYAENYCNPIDRLEKRLPTAEYPFWRYFLLLDENKEVLGFTLFSPTWVTGPDNSGSTHWDGSAAFSFGGGNGIAQDPYIINTAQQLAYLAQNMKDAGSGMGSMHFRLESDLDLNGIEWIPIGGWDSSFRGVFDGNGHTIRGLKVTNGSIQTYEDWTSITAGLFGSSYRATFRDITVEGEIHIQQMDQDFHGSIDAGGLVGNNGAEGTLINCHNRCNIVVEDYAEESSCPSVGGVAGSFGTGSVVDGCSNSGNITVRVACYGSIGGIAAFGANSQIMNCWNTGSLAVEALKSDANGEVGGIVTTPCNTLITNCCNLGALRCVGSLGGIAAYAYNSEDYAQTSAVTNCYSTGDIAFTGNSRYWNPAASLIRNLSKDCLMSRSFYPKGGLKPTDSENSKGTVTDLYTFNAAGELTSGGDLLSALNNWVTENNTDGLYARWVTDSASGFPIPAG